MTVSSELNRKEYAGNGVTTAFATSPVIFFDASDLEVYDVLDSTGVATLKTITTHYTVSGGAGSTGTVTMLTAPASGHTLVIVRSLPLTQADDFVQNDASDAEVVEDAFDRQTMVSQQLQARVDRSIRLPDGDVSGADTELPTPAALTVPGWNAAGTGMTNYPVQTGTSLVNLAASSGSSLVGFDDPVAPAYLKTVSDILNGDRVSVLRNIPKAEWAAIAAYTSTYDSGPKIAELAAAMDTAKRGDLYLGDGLFNVDAAIALPLFIRVGGAQRRGFGSGASNYRGAILKARFAGPVFNAAPGVLTATDILLEHMAVLGEKGTYGAGHGITLSNCAGATLNSMVVAAFGTHNIDFTLGNYLEVRDVYSAQAGDSNFYIDGEHCHLFHATSDGGLYGLRSTTLGYQLTVDGRSHFESATTAGVKLLGDFSRLTGVYTIATTTGAAGVILDANYCEMHGGQVRGGSGSTTVGIDIPAGRIQYRVVGVISHVHQTALRVKEGAGTINANVLSGTDTGLEATSGTYVGIVSDNFISGGTHSIKHVSGNLFKYSNNTTVDGADSITYKAPTIAAGTPKADFRIPWTPIADVVSITVNAASFVTNGNLVTVQFDVTWPANADGTAAALHGLPFDGYTAFANSGGGIGYSEAATVVNIGMSDSTHISFYAADGTAITNATMSGKRIYGTVSYLANT